MFQTCNPSRFRQKETYLSGWKINREGQPCLAVRVLMFSTAAAWGRGSGACLCTSRTRHWRISTSPTISHPPLPTPLATELRLSTKRNFKKRKEKVAPRCVWTSTMAQSIGAILQFSSRQLLSGQHRIFQPWRMAALSLLVRTEQWVSRQPEYILLLMWCQGFFATLCFFWSPLTLIWFFYWIIFLHFMTHVFDICHLSVLLATPWTRHSFSLASTTKVVCSLMEGCKQQNYSIAKYKNGLNFFFFKLNLSGQHWLIRLCNFNPIFVYDQNILGSINDTEGPGVRGDRETLVHPTTSA